MNDINELVKIIEELGGRATSEQIADAYCHKYHVVKQTVHTKTVELTLGEYRELVKYNPDTRLWTLEKDESNNSADDMQKGNSGFSSVFGKEPAVPSTPVYEVYIDGARKLWSLYSGKYDLSPSSPKKEKEGKNRGVEIRKDKKKVVSIFIGKDVTIYIRDKSLVPALHLNFNTDPSSGDNRCTMDTVDDVISSLKDVL